MDQRLDNKVAVITGASHGLGQATAEHLASLGAYVMLIARRPVPLQRVADKIKAAGGQARAFSCDVADVTPVRATAAKISDVCGQVDILVNNAGIPAPRAFLETDYSDWDEVIGVNLSGVFYMTRALWAALTASEAGYVVNISGTAGLRGGGSPAYGSAKFGLTGLNHAIAQAGKAHNLRSTILYPGSMDTGWRGAPIGIQPRAETMDPRVIAQMIAHLVASPFEFVVSEAVLSPLAQPYM